MSTANTDPGNETQAYPHPAHLSPTTPRSSGWEVTLAASEDELDEIGSFRYAVYALEQGRDCPSVNHATRRMDDGLLDREGRVFYVRQRDAVVGTVRLNLGNTASFDEIVRPYGTDLFSAIPRGAMCVTSRLMVAPEFRNSTASIALARACYDTALVRGTILSFIHCVPALVAYFGRLGFRLYGRAFVDPHVGTRVPLVLFTRDVDHLRRVGSPFLSRALSRNVWPCPFVGGFGEVLGERP